MNSFMISVSLGLQYGVPLDVYVGKFSHMRFEPSGPTNDPDIRVAKSIVDYIFRWMGKKFLTIDQQEELGILSAEVRARMAERYANGESKPAGMESAAVPLDAPPPGQTALFNAHEDSTECARCWRADGADRLLLHVQGLRHQHRLQRFVDGVETTTSLPVIRCGGATLMRRDEAWTKSVSRGRCSSRSLRTKIVIDAWRADVRLRRLPRP